MKQIFFTGSEPVLHAEAGPLVPGLNDVHKDPVAERLLAAGAITGDFLPGAPELRVSITRSSDGARWDEELGWVLELPQEAADAPPPPPEVPVEGASQPVEAPTPDGPAGSASEAADAPPEAGQPEEPPKPAPQPARRGREKKE